MLNLLSKGHTIATSIAGVFNYFLHFEQRLRGSAQRHALSLINHGDASDGEDID